MKARRNSLLTGAASLPILGILFSGPWAAADEAPACPVPMEWSKTFAGEGIELLHRIHPMPGGGYLAAGYRYTDGLHFWAIRLDASGDKVWDNLYGGVASQLTDMIPTADGGYLLAGASSAGPGATKSSPNYGMDDAWVVCIDAAGNRLWDRSYGGSGFDAFYGVDRTADGGFILGGVSASAPGGNKTSPNIGGIDFWLIRTDARGEILWQRSYGGPDREFSARARQTADGGFIMVGTTRSGPGGTKTTPHYGGNDAWVIRVDAGGGLLWENCYGGAGSDFIADLRETADGSFILAGTSSSPTGGNKTSRHYGDADAWVLRLDADGSRRWEQSYGGDAYDGMASVVVMADGSFVVGGSSQSPPGGNKTSPMISSTINPWLLWLDADGGKSWEQSYGTGMLNGLRPTADGGFVLAGESFSNDTMTDGWAARLGPRPDCDSDNDGVPNTLDRCPDTPPGEVVNGDGCSIGQLCPCDGEWKNHGDYVRSVVRMAWWFFREGLITKEERREIIRAAARSDCGTRVRLEIVPEPQNRDEVRRDGLCFILSEEVAGRCVLEASEDLRTWEAIRVMEGPVTEVSVAEPESVGEAGRTRFYRVRTEP